MKKAYLVTLTDAEGDRTVFLIDEATYNKIDNDMACEYCEELTLDKNEEYSVMYAKAKDVKEIIRKAEANGYTIADEELDYVHY